MNILRQSQYAARESPPKRGFSYCKLNYSMTFTIVMLWYSTYKKPSVNAALKVEKEGAVRVFLDVVVRSLYKPVSIFGTNDYLRGIIGNGVCLEPPV